MEVISWIGALCWNDLCLLRQKGKVMDIRYQSYNGYSGRLYGKSSMSIYNPEGDLVLHTGSRKPQTLEELKDAVDNFPTFFEMLRK
jgi:hypothetical protein